jgi:predicted transcriptional regulator
MPKPTQDVTDAEFAVLEHLWANASSTIREITDALYAGGGTSHYATVQKLLERLEGKRHVSRDARTSPHRFSAVMNRGQLIGRRLRMMADKLCDGSMAPLLTNLVESNSLTRREIGELRELLDTLDRNTKSAARKK